MAGLVILVMLAGQAGLQTANAPAPASPPRLVEIALQDLPRAIPHGRGTVLVRTPDDPEIRGLGGSGGPMVEFVIPGSVAGTEVIFHGQAIGIAMVQSDSTWPAFELWSGAGGGIYTRAVYAWHDAARQYCAVRVDEFEDHGDESLGDNRVQIAGRGRIVRYARSRPFGCEP
jgi:hypothetical protein